MGLNKPVLSARLDQEVIDQLRFDASQLGVSTATYLEMLIMGRGVTRLDYFAQQSAFQSFVSVALLMNVASRVLDRDQMNDVRKLAFETAGGLFGQPPRRPGTVGGDFDDLDPRISALFDAFAGG